MLNTHPSSWPCVRKVNESEIRELLEALVSLRDARRDWKARLVSTQSSRNRTDLVASEIAALAIAARWVTRGH
jgi:hypothetical protein